MGIRGRIGAGERSSSCREVSAAVGRFLKERYLGLWEGRWLSERRKRVTIDYGLYDTGKHQVYFRQTGWYTGRAAWFIQETVNFGYQGIVRKGSEHGGKGEISEKLCHPEEGGHNCIRVILSQREWNELSKIAGWNILLDWVWFLSERETSVSQGGGHNIFENPLYSQDLDCSVIRKQTIVAWKK